MRVRAIFILSLLAAATCVKAQTGGAGDTVLRGSTIEVIQSYKPKVKQTPKPEWVPQLPPADTTHAALNYEVPQQTLYYTYNSMPLRPLELGKNTDQSPYPNYVKAGGGNLSTLFLDAGIGSFSGDNYESAIHLHHLSQKGPIKDQQTALSGIEAEGTLHQDKNDWHASVNAERNQYYYYGFNHDLIDFNKDSIRQTYATIRVAVDVKNKPDSTDRFSYNPGINASTYNARYKTNEVTIGINAPVSYKLDSNLDLVANLQGAITRYKSDTFSSNNNFIELSPGLDLHKNALSGHALLGLAAGKAGDFYVLPDILATYDLPDTRLAINAGWQATLRQNTYEQLTTENPYLNSLNPVLQTRKDEAFLGMYGGHGDHFTFSLRGSWWNYNNLPTFINGDNLIDQKQFFIVYDNVNALSLQVSARYQVANIWSAGVKADFYRFYNGSERYVWQEPSTRIKADVTVVPTSKLTITAYLAMLGGIHAMDTSGNTVNLKTALDLGANVEYQIVRRLSAFAQVSNLLNDKYQRWMGYQSYGLNIYGGLRLKF